MASVTCRAQFWQVMPPTSNSVTAELRPAFDSTVCGDDMLLTQIFYSIEGLSSNFGLEGVVVFNGGAPVSDLERTGSSRPMPRKEKIQFRNPPPRTGMAGVEPVAMMIFFAPMTTTSKVSIVRCPRVSASPH
jgi:hypothetical protein